MSKFLLSCDADHYKKTTSCYIDFTQHNKKATTRVAFMPNKPRDLRFFSTSDQKPSDDRDDVVRIDIERMNASLKSGILKVPTGLSREEKLRFILEHSK